MIFLELWDNFVVFVVFLFVNFHLGIRERQYKQNSANLGSSVNGFSAHRVARERVQIASKTSENVPNIIV